MQAAFACGMLEVTRDDAIWCVDNTSILLRRTKQQSNNNDMEGVVVAS
jgi:hypothetical protein